MELGDELKRRGVAAGTIKEALGPWREQEMLRIISGLAKGPATLESLLEWKAAATAFYRLTKELEQAMNFTEGE